MDRTRWYGRGVAGAGMRPPVRCLALRYSSTEFGLRVAAAAVVRIPSYWDNPTCRRVRLRSDNPRRTRMRGRPRTGPIPLSAYRRAGREALRSEERRV